ncbi:hypothetical protein IHE61_31050 [Streptomyces sp. GKU 257-1]|nr:hypothetical protein [Streptomyces sp. GKU 257-1]
MATTSPTPPYTLGDADTECRYPVIIGADVPGRVFRWHREWFADTSEGEHNLGRPPKGTNGVDMAAAYVAEEYAAGRITVVPLAEEPRPTAGYVPLLHPRMPETPRNVQAAKTAFAALAEHRWQPVRTGFPGSDNPWYLACQMPGCTWEGPRYWSHLRGRNGNPPSPHRHPGGCIGKERVQALIPAYRMRKTG